MSHLSPGSAGGNDCDLNIDTNLDIGTGLNLGLDDREGPARRKGQEAAVDRDALDESFAMARTVAEAMTGAALIDATVRADIRRTVLDDHARYSPLEDLPPVVVAPSVAGPPSVRPAPSRRDRFNSRTREAVDRLTDAQLARLRAVRDIQTNR
ncbi:MULTISPECIES: hypothetical protein [unclassified Nocardioides]|uniref:hypothetical protein n=1 Tax=unclassified Nocardioides TaxID=2615069 RepID=UPI00301557F5